MTIDLFNKLTGHETLHPLICMADLSKTNLSKDIRMACNFYGLLYYNIPEQDKVSERVWLRLIHPGEIIEIPSKQHVHSECYSGVLFHPDLLCGTSLEGRIESYPKRCHCRGVLSEHERRIIADNFGKSVRNCTMPSTVIVRRLSFLISSCCSIIVCVFATHTDNKDAIYPMYVIDIFDNSFGIHY